LTGKGVSTINYRIANASYRAFSCKCLGDYLLIYNLLDVLLLADVWQNYREITQGCSNIGFLVCCDLKIPQMPLCSEKSFIKSEFVSLYQSALVDLFKHLTANPFDKEIFVAQSF